MPAKFDRCVKSGGKVRTIKPNANTYIHVCKGKGAKKTVAGYPKKVKGKK